MDKGYGPGKEFAATMGGCRMIGTVQGVVGTPIVFEGYANDFDRAVRAVQFSLDDGRTWTTHETPGTTADRNLYWRFEYVPERAGAYELLVRSVNEDGTGSPQPARVAFLVADEPCGSIG